MFWKLQFDLKIQEYFLHGRDNQRRLELHHILVEQATNKEGVLNLQIGVARDKTEKHGKNWVSIDLYDQRPCIDYNMDLEEIRIQDGTFNFIECNAVLEHCKRPWICAQELYRVCRPNGEIWIEVPYMQYYHPFKNYSEDQHGIICDLLQGAKEDQEHGGHYFNFTPQGICEIMKPFHLKELLLINEGGLVFYGVK